MGGQLSRDDMTLCNFLPTGCAAADRLDRAEFRRSRWLARM